MDGIGRTGDLAVAIEAKGREVAEQDELARPLISLFGPSAT